MDRREKNIIILYSIKYLVFIIETECVYCAVRTESLSAMRPRFVLKGLMTSAKTFYVIFCFWKMLLNWNANGLLVFLNICAHILTYVHICILCIYINNVANLKHLSKQRSDQLDATNSDLLVISSISTYFGHLYAHHQEIRLRSTAYSCLSCCSCCDAGESGGKMCALCEECCRQQQVYTIKKITDSMAQVHTDMLVVAYLQKEFPLCR